MPLDFPDHPLLGDYYISGRHSYRWDGVKWVNAYSSPTGPFLPLTMTGSTTLTGTGTAPNQFIFNFLTASAAKPNDGSQINGYLVDQSSGGSFSDMYCNARFDCTMQGNSSTGITGVLSQMSYLGIGGSGGYVPFYGQMSRRTVNAGGSAQNPQIWGAVLEVIDWTNTDSAGTNFMSGLEIDMTVGNTDSAKNRRGFGMYLNKANASDAAPVVATGMHIAANTGSYDRMFVLESPFNEAAIDLRVAVASSPSAHTIWLRDGGDIAFDTAGTGRVSWSNITGSAIFTCNIGTAGGIGIGGSGGPTWTTGTAVPTANAPIGSLYSRANGTVGATLYVSRASGTWAAVAGV
jgi:hypothetical protein